MALEERLEAFIDSLDARADRNDGDVAAVMRRTADQLTAILAAHRAAESRDKQTNNNWRVS